MHRMKSLYLIEYLFTFILFVSTHFAQTDGQLDTSFDDDGKITTQIGYDSDSQSGGVAIQSDGKIVVVGSSKTGSYYDFEVVRYNTDGSLDTNFGTNGRVTTDVGGHQDLAYDVEIQSDGKIVVVGNSYYSGTNDFSVVRYNTDGSLDTDFGTGGKKIINYAISQEYAYGVAIQSDGKIVIVGSSSGSPSEDFCTMRLTTAGILDVSFNSSGQVFQEITSSADIAYDVGIQSDGKILVAGYSTNGGYKDYTVVRYNSDGSIDLTFDASEDTPDGILITDIVSSGDDIAKKIYVDTSNNSYYLAGYGTWVGFILAKYNSDGTFDTSFDTDGVATVVVIDGLEILHGLGVMSDGKFVLGGYKNNPYDFALAVFNTDGSLYSGFSSDGKLQSDLGGYEFYGMVAIQSDDKIVLFGESSNQFVTARYTTSGSLDTSFDTDGFTTQGVGTGTSYARAVAIQSDKKILIAGSSQGSASDKDVTVVRYNLDGSLDTNFGEFGVATTIVSSSYEEPKDIFVQSNGKIVVVGDINYGGSVFVIRYNSDGSLDTSFDTDGVLTTSSLTAASKVYVYSDGKILVAGESQGYYFGMMKLNSDGSMDNTFGSSGIVYQSVGTGYSKAYGLVIQSDSKILLGGVAIQSGSYYSMALVRFASNGSLDTEFGSSGIAFKKVGNSSYNDSCNDLALQSDGKILAAGTAYISNNDFAIVRFNTDGSVDTDWGASGVVTTSIGSVDYGYSIILLSNGDFLVGGAAYMSNFDFAIVRYNSDGTLDTDFDTDGKVTTTIGSGDDSGYDMAVNSDGNIFIAGQAYITNHTEFAAAMFSGSTSPLPVELTEFSARTVNGQVHLSWETATEINNYGFEVQRNTPLLTPSMGEAEDTGVWETIGFVNGYGNSNSPKYYSFVDENPTGGFDLQYRLKQTDFDGAFEYSDAVSIHLTLPSSAKLEQNYPNPFNPSTAIKFTLVENTDVELKVYDLTGQELATLVNDNKSPGSYVVYWHGRDNSGRMSASGVYIYSLKAGSIYQTRKMTLLK